MFSSQNLLLLTATVLAIPSAVFSQPGLFLGDDEILARIGPKTITVRDFTERLELMPWPGMEHPATHDSSRAKAFLSLVAEKLLALQAADLGLVVNTGNSSTLQAMERGLARDRLFREEIRGKVTFAPEEIEQGLRRLSQRLTLGIFRMRDEGSAIRLADALNAQSDSIPPSLPVDGIIDLDSVSITFGDLPRSYEDTAYTLTLLKAKPSFSTAGGWMVFHLLDASTNPSYPLWTMQERINTVRRRLERFKEQELSAEYLRSYFTEKIKLDSAAFHLLADTLIAIMRRDPAVKDEQGNYSLTSLHLDIAKRSLDQVSDEPVIRSGNDVVPLGRLIDELRFHPTRFTSLEPDKVTEQFNATLRQTAQSALVAEDAVRKGYHQHPEVQRDLGVWVDALGAQKLLKHIVDSVGDGRSHSPDSLLPGVVKGRETFRAINEYLIDIAKRFSPELYTDKLRRVKIGAGNMVTRRHFGFGGSMTAMPLLIRLWDWYEAWQAGTVVSP